MKKGIGLMLVFFMLVFTGMTAFAGGEKAPKAEKEEVKKYLIGISQPTFNHPIRQAHYWAAEIWKEKHPNVEFIFMDGQKHAAKQIADIEDLTARHVDMIMIAEHSAGSCNGALKKAKSVGIPIVAFDRVLTDDTIPVSTITGDDVKMGTLCAEYLVKALNGKGNIVMIQAPEGVNIGEFRREGFHSVIDKYPDMKVLTTQVGNWQRSVALTVMENILQGFKEIDAVYADNDEMALGALQAIKEAGREGKITVVGIDGEKAALESMKEGGMAFTAKKVLEFPLALDIAMDILEGREYPKLVVLDPVGVSKENLEEQYNPFALF